MQTNEHKAAAALSAMKAKAADRAREAAANFQLWRGTERFLETTALDNYLSNLAEYETVGASTMRSLYLGALRQFVACEVKETTARDREALYFANRNALRLVCRNFERIYARYFEDEYLSGAEYNTLLAVGLTNL